MILVHRALLATLIAGGLLFTGCGGSKQSAPRSTSKKPKKVMASQDEYELEELEPGQGPKPKKGDRVEVNYAGYLVAGRGKDGKLIAGEEFDSSRGRSKAFSFKVGDLEVIRGWEDAILEMQAGGRYRLVVPPKQGYGDRGQPPKIPPDATLIFDMELVRIVKKGKKYKPLAK